MKKRCLSFLLAAVLLLSVFAATALSVLAADASRDYLHELWFLVGKERAMSRGTVAVCPGAPFSPEASPETAYLPLETVAAYAGASVERTGDEITLVRGEDTCTLTVGSAAWKKNGAEMAPFLLDVLSEDGVVYISILTATAIFGLQSYFDRDVGLVVLSERSIVYRTGDQNTLKIEVENASLFLFEYPSGAEIFANTAQTIGEGTYPRLLVGQDRFDTLSALWHRLSDEEDPLTDEDEIRLANWVYNRVRLTGKSFSGNFLEITGEEQTEEDADAALPSEPGIYPKDSFTLYYRHPYYFYTADGERLLGLGGKTIHKQDGYGRRIDIESVFLSDGSLRTDLTDADGEPLEAIYDERGYRVLSKNSCESISALGDVKVMEKDYSYYGEGNDVGGRLNTSVNLANFARDLAFAY